MTHSTSIRWLTRSAVAWTTVAVTGQLFFALYITMLYGGGLVTGRLAEALDAIMPRGHVPGDTVGNTVIATHLFMAVLMITLSGVQLLPVIRRRAPHVHRWSGRLFATLAALLALGGLYLVWVRGGAAGDAFNHLGVSSNALVILYCVVMTVRAARARDISTHRRWALRLYLATNGVWFFRIGLTLWLAIHGRAVGFDPKTFTGPFLIALAFAQFLLPLLILEGYFRAREHGRAVVQMAMATVLVMCTVATAAGIGTATMILWWPRI
jgi:uncharacterized membrane protein